MNKPQISCIIPAYENLSLFSRCLFSVLCQKDILYEVIICDDSLSKNIKEFVGLLSIRYSQIRYIKGPCSGNPVHNWNMGIDQSESDYCVIIHHDEFLVNENYLKEAVDKIKKENLDAVICGCAVVGIKRYSRFFLLSSLMSLITKPIWMLFAINWIGATANVIFKKSDLRFDIELKYLVDVDFYYNLLIKKRAYGFLTDICVISIAHHPNQITASYDFLSTNLKEINFICRSKNYCIKPAQFFLLRLFANFKIFFGYRK